MLYAESLSLSLKMSMSSHLCACMPIWNMNQVYKCMLARTCTHTWKCAHICMLRLLPLGFKIEWVAQDTWFGCKFFYRLILKCHLVNQLLVSSKLVICTIPCNCSSFLFLPAVGSGGVRVGVCWRRKVDDSMLLIAFVNSNAIESKSGLMISSSWGL